MMLPFSGGFEHRENGLMIFAILAACLYLMRPESASGAKWPIVKTIPVALFALIAWYQTSPTLLIAALALSAVGDYLLAYEGERAFLGGLVAFFLAHVGYVVLFGTQGPALVMHYPWRIALALVFLVHAGLMARRLSGAVPADMRIPVFAYIGAISLMGLFATLFASPIILLGVCLFIVSDTLLAIGRFLIAAQDRGQKLVQPGVWVTYIAAQTLILLGFAG